MLNFILAIGMSVRVKECLAGMAVNVHSIRNQGAKPIYMKPKTISLLGALIVAAGFFSVGANARATIVDLTTGPNASGEIDGALFFATNPQPTGTGYIDPFLRIQEKGFEQGYNTDGGFPFDDKHPHQYQHSLLISDLTPTIFEGNPYLVFMIDSNQSGNAYSQHTISMDCLQIFTSNDPNQTTESFNANGILALNGTLVYNLDASMDSAVLATALGSGKGDYFVFLPLDLVLTGEQYLYIYTCYGNTIVSSGGFEEWTFIPGTVPIPETATLFPVIGLVAAVLSTRLLRRRKIAHLARQQTFPAKS
jgi:hypothetical protein